MWLEPETIKTAYELFNSVTKSAKLTSRLRRLKKKILSGELQVIVSGAGGVGKSTFARVLVSENPMFADEDYRPDLTTKKVTIPGDFPARLLVVPGQERYLTTEWAKATEQIRTARSAGVVNIVAFGYHSISVESISQIMRPREGTSVEAVLGKYLEERRQAEIDRLGFLLSGLEGIDRPIWMMTFVAKQDLWWSEAQRVHRHYTEGDYGTAIEKFQSIMQEKRLGFSHHFVGVSQTHQNYGTKLDGDLALTSAGYTLTRHLESLSNAIGRFWEIAENGHPAVHVRHGGQNG